MFWVKICLLISSAILLLFSLLFKKDTSCRWFCIYIWFPAINFLLRTLANIRYDVINRRSVRKVRKAIFIGNHQSMLDIIILSKCVKRFKFVLKKELMNFPLFARILRKQNMIVTTRGSEGAAKDLKNILTKSKILLNKGHNVIIFAQGTRTPVDYDVQDYPYKVGFYKLYQEGYQCIPFVLNTGKYWPKKGKMKSGNAKCKFLPPIKQGLSKEEFINTLTNTIESEWRKL